MAQMNLVMNPSLEQYSVCPIHDDEIRYAYGWESLDTTWMPPDFSHDLNGVPEYCNVCSSGYSWCSVPSALLYHHYPRTGNGMAEVQMFYNEYIDSPNWYERDYLQGHLSTTLTAGESYCVTFYVVYESGSKYTINHIGAYLDDGTIDTTGTPERIQRQYAPQIIENEIISDTLNWTKVQSSFIATGIERFITIGNFTDTAHMSFVPTWDTGIYGTSAFGPMYSWYLVDDISVIKSDAAANAGPDKIIAAGGDTVLIGDTLDSYVPAYWYANGLIIDSNKSGIYVHPDTTTTYVLALELCGRESYDTVVVWLASDTTHDSISYVRPLNDQDIQVYPNPASNTITITHAAGTIVIMFDAVGQEVFYTLIHSNKEIENIQSLAPGVYVLQLVDQVTGYKIAKRIVKE